MKLRDLIENVQIRDGVEINVLDGEYTQKDSQSWVDMKGTLTNIYRTQRGTDFKHRLELNEITEDYLDYEVYCISGMNSKNKIAIDIRKAGK